MGTTKLNFVRKWRTVTSKLRPEGRICQKKGRMGRREALEETFACHRLEAAREDWDKKFSVCRGGGGDETLKLHY